VGILFVLFELYFARCYGSGTTSEYRLEISTVVCVRTGSVWSKISGTWGRLHQLFFLSKN